MTETTGATQTVTIEARIWKVSDHGSGLRAELYMGSGHGRYTGINWFHTRIPLTATDRVTWFQVTLEGNVIIGVTV